MNARLGSFIVRRRRAVMVLWAVVLLVTAVFGSSAFSVLSSEFGPGSGTESGRVDERLSQLAATGGEIVIIADGVDLGPNEVEPRPVPDAIASDLAEIAAVPGVISVLDPWTTGVSALRSTDGLAALVVVTLAGGMPEEEMLDVAHRVGDVARGLDAATVSVGGEVLVGETFATASEADLLRGEAIALPIAIVVMVLLLGGLVGAGMPLLVAIGGVVTTLAVLVGATHFGDVSIFSVNVVNMLGIGLGIDYGLLMVNRFREERAAGRDVHDAVVHTVSTAGTTVMFSALTVAVAMSGLFVFGLPLLTSFGVAGLSVVLMCMAASVTLLPAALAAVGGRIPPAVAAPVDTGRFYRWARWVQRHAAIVGAMAVAVLIVLGLPFLNAKLENGDARTLPRSSEVRSVALTLAERFPSRGTDPVTVVASTDPTDRAFVAWYDQVSVSEGVVGATIRTGTPSGMTVIDLVPEGTSQGPAATALVDRLRADRPSFDIDVGGWAAELVDVQGILTQRLPWAAFLVVSATLVLLFLMTGSLIVPIKAVVMNVLSLGASFGALVWVFQDGHLSGLLAFDSVGALDLWMPILILIFAFGLSMDYEVFLLSRIKEVHDETGDNDLAVAVGLQRSGKIISSAAALIVVVFAGFAAGEVLAIKQLGVGLAIAVIVDATIVRSLLVPATMNLLGERNWWAPAPMRRFHDRFGLREQPTGDGSAVSPARTEAPTGTAPTWWGGSTGPAQ